MRAMGSHFDIMEDLAMILWKIFKWEALQFEMTNDDSSESIYESFKSTSDLELDEIIRCSIGGMIFGKIASSHDHTPCARTINQNGMIICR